jgi:hypothetical protein
LCRWRETHSIPYSLCSVEAKELAHLAKEKVIKKPKPMPQTADEPANLENIKFLESKHFQYRRNFKSNPLLQGRNVHGFIESLVNDNPDLMDSKVTLGSGIAMFCGGPLSALAFCPRTDSLGK